MTKTADEYLEAMEGFFAYDSGATDSGIRNDTLKHEARLWLKSLSEEEFRLAMSRWVRDAFLSEKAIAQGYGIEDVVSYINWLSREMGCDL